MILGIVAIFASLLALGYAGYLSSRIMKISPGTPKMQEIADAIKEGAMAYMARQYKTIAVFAVIITILLGFLFALGWSPCLGPILGTILLLASTTGTTLSGGLLLGVYSLGLALPFLLIAFFYGSSVAYVPKLERYLPLVNRIGGVLLVVIGLLLVFGQFGMLNTWAGEILGDRLFNGMVQYM